MVWPILAGAAAGIGGTLLGGLTKKEGSTYAQTYHSPYETYSPTDARVYNIQYPSYQVQIDSPLASQTTKKEQSTAIEQKPQVTGATGSQVPEGTNFTTIAIIGAIALVVYGVTSKGGKK